MLKRTKVFALEMAELKAKRNLLDNIIKANTDTYYWESKYILVFYIFSLSSKIKYSSS